MTQSCACNAFRNHYDSMNSLKRRFDGAGATDVQTTGNVAPRSHTLVGLHKYFHRRSCRRVRPHGAAVDCWQYVIGNGTLIVGGVAASRRAANDLDARRTKQRVIPGGECRNRVRMGELGRRQYIIIISGANLG